MKFTIVQFEFYGCEKKCKEKMWLWCNHIKIGAFLFGTQKFVIKPNRNKQMENDYNQNQKDNFENPVKPAELLPGQK